MTDLSGFSRMTFVDQVNTIEKIKAQRSTQAIPGLFNLCESEAHNDALLFMIKTTIMALLPLDKEQTEKGLSLKDPIARRLCIEAAGQERFMSTVPILMDMCATERDETLLLEIFTALSRIHPAGAEELFRDNLKNQNPSIAAACANALGFYRDRASAHALFDIIENAQQEGNYETCDIVTLNAITSLGKMHHDTAAELLTQMIHHKNPTVRRIIHEKLIETGPSALPLLADIFNGDDGDAMIMSANVLGVKASHRACDVLVQTMDRRGEFNANIRFAIYEALGKIPSVESLVCITEGLKEKEEMVLMGIVFNLDSQFDPLVLEKTREILLEKNEHSQMLVHTIISAHALNIFDALYMEDDTIAELFIKEIKASSSPDTIRVFRKALEKLGKMATAHDLLDPDVQSYKKQVIVADTSMSMLLFYTNILSDMGFDCTTVLNGKQAWDYLKTDRAFDLIITNMNMPEMDGVELTRLVRGKTTLDNAPILMVTTETHDSQISLAQKAGVNHFIHKPFTSQELGTMIAEIT
ncbi:MAG: response regulator [Thermodesulfobacteriota bacterium]|nr:response regulator [Thermodesulfobacteriota bacterium]